MLVRRRERRDSECRKEIRNGKHRHMRNNNNANYAMQI